LRTQTAQKKIFENQNSPKKNFREHKFSYKNFLSAKNPLRQKSGSQKPAAKNPMGPKTRQKSVTKTS